MYRVHQYTTYPGRGGAGIAAQRLVRGLRGEGIEARLIGLPGNGTGEEVYPIHYRRGPGSNLRRRWRSWLIRKTAPDYPGLSASGSVFFCDRSAHGVAMAESFAGADLLHFHWVCDLLDYQDTLRGLDGRLPVVWTMHDMGAFTGGCSYSLDCHGFTDQCLDCPQQASPAAREEAARSFSRKAQALGRFLPQPIIVTPSHWLAGEVRRSRIFGNCRCEVIANGYDLSCFHPGRRKAGRRRLGAGEKDLVFLFSAASIDNPIKGMRFLLRMIPRLEEKNPNLRIAYVGGTEQSSLPSHWTGLGSFTDEAALAEIYAGADLLLLPSLADNFPNVVGEAISTGTPAAVSGVGGVPEMVMDGETGFILDGHDEAHWLERLHQFLSWPEDRRLAMREACRRFARDHFSLEASLAAHRALYEELLLLTR